MGVWRSELGLGLKLEVQDRVLADFVVFVVSEEVGVLVDDGFGDQVVEGGEHRGEWIVGSIGCLLLVERFLGLLDVETSGLKLDFHFDFIEL